MIECIVVGLGGFLGAVSRYLIGLVPVREGMAFPIKTFVINIIGSFAIGLIAAAAARAGAADSRLVLFLKVGICGGFTTFSTFSNDSLLLLKQGHPGTFIFYALASVILGIIMVWAGAIAGKR